MPRHIPWVNKGNKPKQPLKPAKPNKSKIPLNPDDDFFKGTVLEKDDVDLRAPSSSPPPIVELPPPEIEFMDSGVNKFDLRDDEWIMVEDEFLQTAKLFTRHLHLAEYERMKSMIEEKKSQVSRPTVRGAKPSIGGKLRVRAEEQAKAQEEAVKNVDMGLLKARTPLKRSTPVEINVKSASGRGVRSIDNPAPAPAESTIVSSDSDDLDAPRKRTYTKPAFNDKTKQTTRVSWSLDNETSTSMKTTSKSSLVGASSCKARQAPAGVRTNRTKDLWSEEDDVIPKRSVLSKDMMDRLAKRKADEEKKGAKKAQKKDVEIPTFMF